MLEPKQLSYKTIVTVGFLEMAFAGDQLLLSNGVFYNHVQLHLLVSDCFEHGLRITIANLWSRIA